MTKFIDVVGLFEREAVALNRNPQFTSLPLTIECQVCFDAYLAKYGEPNYAVALMGNHPFRRSRLNKCGHMALYLGGLTKFTCLVFGGGVVINSPKP